MRILEGIEHLQANRCFFKKQVNSLVGEKGWDCEWGELSFLAVGGSWRFCC